MKNIEIARMINTAFRQLTNKTSQEATNGSTKAARRLLSMMAAHHTALKTFGYSLNDSGKLVKYREPSEQVKFQSALALRASAGDINAAKQLLETMSGIKL